MNFKEQKEYIKKNKKIDGHRFNKATEITTMIDFLNEEKRVKEEKWAEDETHEISKFLAGILTRKTFILNRK